MQRKKSKRPEDQFTLQLFNNAVVDLYKKPVQVSQMLVNNGIMTGQQVKAWNLLLKNAKEQNDEIKASGSRHLSGQTFRIDRITLMEQMGYTSTNRKPFKDALKAMQSLQATWDVLKADGNNQWTNCVLIPYISIDNEFVHYSFVEQIQPMLFESKIYSKLDLQQQRKLKLDAAIRLYDWVSRYKSNPGNLTASHEWQMWRHIIYGEIDSNSYLTEYKIFKRDKLIPAINEINQETDLLLKLIEDRQGARSIKNLQFLIQEKPKIDESMPTQSVRDDATFDINTEFEALGITKHYATKIKKNFSISLIKANVEYLKERLKNSTNDPIRNKGAYLVSACESNYAGFTGEVIDNTNNDNGKNVQDILTLFNKQRTDQAIAMFGEMSDIEQTSLISEYNQSNVMDEAKIPLDVSERLNRHMIPFFGWLAKKTWGDPSHQEIIEFTLSIKVS